MSRIDITIIILLFAVIGFVLGMALSELPGRPISGLIWAITGAGLGTIVCVVVTLVSRKGDGNA